MRNPERIPKVLAELGSIWSEMPDLRLGQLIMIAGGERTFSMEDEELMQNLREKIFLIDQK